MQIRHFLELTADKAISNYSPEARQVREQLLSYNVVDESLLAHLKTGADVLRVLGSLDRLARENILNYELNDGADLKTISEEVRKMTTGGSGSGARVAITVMMGLVVFLTSLAFTTMVVYVGIKTQEYPSWEVMVLPFLIPGMVIWHVFGVLSKERKDALLVAVGKIPEGPQGVLKALFETRGKPPVPPRPSHLRNPPSATSEEATPPIKP